MGRLRGALVCGSRLVSSVMMVLLEPCCEVGEYGGGFLMGGPGQLLSSVKDPHLTPAGLALVLL